MDASDNTFVRQQPTTTPTDRGSAADDLGHLDSVISGSRANTGNAGGAVNTGRPDSNGFSPWLVLQILSVYISRHSKSVTLVCTVLVSAITIVMSLREVQTSRENFRIEMAAQARSTSALLFNDYVNELRFNYPGAHKGAELDAEAARFLGAQTQFILNGVSDHKFRAEILTFLGVTNLSAMLKPRLSAGKIEAPLSLHGMSFDGGKIRGNFPEGLFAWNSFKGVTLDNVDFSEATLQYADFRDARISQGSFVGSTFRCVSLANAQIIARPPNFQGSVFQNSDLRGLSISSDIITSEGESFEENRKERALAKMFDGAEFHNVLMDAEVALHLEELQRGSIVTDASMNHEQWINEMKNTDHCNKNQS